METTQQHPAAWQLGEIHDEGGLNLGQVLAALKRRVFIIAGMTALITSGAVIKALTDTPIYQSEFEVLTQPVTLETRIISKANPEGLSNQEDLIGSSVDPVKIRILKSPKVLEPIAEELQENYPGLTYAEIFSGLSLSIAPGDILVVRYSNPNKSLAQDILISLADSYIEFSVEDRQSDILRGIDFVEEQLPGLRDRVDFLQDSLQDLRQKHNLVDPQQQGNQLIEQISALESEQLQVNVQLQEAQQVYQALQQDVVVYGDDAVSSFLQQDPKYQQVLSLLLDLDTQLAQDSLLLRESSPEIQHLLQRRASLIPVLQQEGQRVQRQVQRQIDDLIIRNQVLGNSINRLNLQVKDLSSITRLYSDIQRELDIATTNLNEFLSKREALRIEAAQRQAPWEILTPPGPPKASVASAKQNLVLGILLGVILGSGAALVLDKLSSIVHTTKEVRDIIPLPLLGIIPFNSMLNDDLAMVISQTQNADWQRALNNDTEAMAIDLKAFSEAFRSLNANLRLISLDRDINSLTISSAASSEGKSTIAIHLAQASAIMGRKVLLVDLDLRRPSLHRQLGLTNEYGLMDVILADAAFQDVLHPLAMSPNISVMTSGGFAPDPTTILASSAMNIFHQQAREMFDLIIYDVPPLLGFADAYLAAALSQHLLLVVGLGQVKRSQLQNMMDSLKVPDINPLGVIVNGATETSAPIYEHYDYYVATTEAQREAEELEQMMAEHNNLLGTVSQSPGQKDS